MATVTEIHLFRLAMFVPVQALHTFSLVPGKLCSVRDLFFLIGVLVVVGVSLDPRASSGLRRQEYFPSEIRYPFRTKIVSAPALASST